MAGDPLALGRGFDEDARLRLICEHLVEARPGGLDAALGQFAAFAQGADLAGSLVQVDADEVHGWPPSARLGPRVQRAGHYAAPRRPAASYYSILFGRFTDVRGVGLGGGMRPAHSSEDAWAATSASRSPSRISTSSGLCSRTMVGTSPRPCLRQRFGH